MGWNDKEFIRFLYFAICINTIFTIFSIMWGIANTIHSSTFIYCTSGIILTRICCTGLDFCKMWMNEWMDQLTFSNNREFIFTFIRPIVHFEPTCLTVDSRKFSSAVTTVTCPICGIRTCSTIKTWVRVTWLDFYRKEIWQNVKGDSVAFFFCYLIGRENIHNPEINKQVSLYEPFWM